MSCATTVPRVRLASFLAAGRVRRVRTAARSAAQPVSCSISFACANSWMLIWMCCSATDVSEPVDADVQQRDRCHDLPARDRGAQRPCAPERLHHLVLVSLLLSFVCLSHVAVCCIASGPRYSLRRCVCVCTGLGMTAAPESAVTIQACRASDSSSCCRPTKFRRIDAQSNQGVGGTTGQNWIICASRSLALSCAR